MTLFLSQGGNHQVVLTTVSKEPLPHHDRHRHRGTNKDENYCITKQYCFLNRGREERLVIQIPSELLHHDSKRNLNKDLEPQVIWYHGSSDALRIHRKYKYSSHQQNPSVPIIPNDVCLCSFSSNEVMLCILLDNNRIEIYGESGRSFIVSLPFKIHKLWSLNNQILIMERKILSVEQKQNTNPMLYFLTSPLHEVKALASVIGPASVQPGVTSDDGDVLMDGEQTFDYMKNGYETILYLYSDLFMVTHDSNSKLISLYLFLEEGFVQRIQFSENCAEYLKCVDTEYLQISIFHVDTSGNRYILYVVNNNTLFAFEIERNSQEEDFFLLPKFSKQDVIAVAEFNDSLVNEKLFNGNIGGGLHLMLISESSRDGLILVLNGEYIMWNQSLEKGVFKKIDFVVENRFSLASNDSLFRFSLDICPSSKLVQDCLSVFQAILSKDLHCSIFYDFQISRNAAFQEWEIFSSLILYLGLNIMPPTQQIPEDDPWKLMEFLETNSSTNNICNTPCMIDFSKLQTSSKTLVANLPLILFSLHLLYENYKLHVTEWSKMEMLGSLLFEIATTLQWHSYCEVYQRDFNYTLTSRTKSALPNMRIELKNDNIKFLNEYYASGILTPNIMGWIEEILLNGSIDKSCLYPVISNCSATSLSKKVCRLFSLLVNGSDDIYDIHNSSSATSDIYMDVNHLQALSELASHERVAIALLQEGFTSIDQLEFLPFSVSLPIREALILCRNSNQPVTRTTKFCKLIEREDLSINNNQLEMERPFREKQIISEFSKIAGVPPPNSSSSETDEDIGHMIWSEDRRLEQVSKMLDSSRPTQIQKHTLQLTEDDLDGFDPNDAPDLQRQILLNIKQQLLSFCIGKGMLTLSSKRHINSSISRDTTASNVLAVPPIALSVKLKRNRAIMSIDISKIVLENEISASCSTQWAEFHNGVATGLTIGTDCKITKEWIMFHKPNKRGTRYLNDSVTHAGLLLALGLQGHLKCLGPTDIYGYLQQRHEATTIGILLGLSCSYIGTQDQYITRSLSLYIPSLVVGMSDMEMPMEVSGSALLGIGLLYMGSCHRFMTEVLLGELARPPNDNSTNTRESYSLSAGLALGLVHLGKGPTGNSHELKMDQRLLSYMTGGSKRPEFDMFALMASKSKAHPSLKNGTNSSEAVTSTCSRIKENEKFVNVDVTGPGACLALTLKYLKTHDEAIASEMKVPDTKYMLDYVRPDMIILRQLGSSLIMWNTIKNSECWIKSKIPELFRSTPAETIIDSSELCKIYAHVICGCCLSIGFKYAGSHDSKAFDLILNIVQQAMKMRLKLYAHDASIPYYVKLDKFTSDRTIIIGLLSLSCIMSGSGNVEVIRLVKQLRQKYISSPSTLYGGYGIHMALSMSLGLVFLGGGRFSLSTSDRSIAALLCSLYPVFPQTTTDNRYHSQALRHLYILAAENRLLETLDIDTKESCHVPVTIETTQGMTLQKLSPCLIPESHLISKITTSNERYYPLTITEFPLKSNIIYVKKKSGYLTHKDDPKGIRSSVHSNFISNLVDQNPDNLVKLFEKMSSGSHTHIAPYVKYRIFGQNSSTGVEEQTLTKAIQSLSLNDTANGNIALLLYHSLVDSLMNDSPDVLYIFEHVLEALRLIVERSSCNNGSGTSSNNFDSAPTRINFLSKSIYISCFKQLFAYHSSRDRLLKQQSSQSSLSTKPLISQHFIECIRNYLENYFASMDLINWTAPSTNENFGSFCTFYSLPYLYLIQQLVQQNKNQCSAELLVRCLKSIQPHSSIPTAQIERLVQHIISRSP
ncbi:hypothetical protein FDP41_007405 [Naegleria fowleri]|uniref:Uncharacterized protein n=1 Tax=Naegleria fowleri TaxID=5763 RepID=A0A6A5CFV5_NAEFO|nr:uncharacterized protein FDP41_007405 [Naegleria fowleri]KAF0984228.1 hypothetical protein FDP41_007405 [Naegleria fowleri]